MAVQTSVNRRRCSPTWWLLAGAGVLPVLACEPDWNELTNGSAARPPVAGSAGTGGTAGSESTGGAPAAPPEGGSPSSGDAGSAGEVMVETGGAPAGGEGGMSPMDDGALDLPGTASADSEEISKGNVAANGHDGDYNTRWVAADGALDHYWTLDLGSVHRLARVKIRWEYPFGPQPVSYLYTVSVSDDGTVFALALDKRDNQETSLEQVAELPAGTTGRHVRITVTGLPPPGAHDYWASFYEARVFGFPIVP